MSKLIGYIIAVIGLVIAVLSFNSSKIPLISSLKSSYILIAGLVLVAVGVILSLSRGKATQAEEEVPIYHGKKIVGYRKQK